MSHERLREDVAARRARLAHEGLLVGTAGNVSARGRRRRRGHRVRVTLAGCRPEDVTVVSLDGEVVEGELRPTSELSLHLGPTPTPRHAAVVHTHAPYSTAVACVLDELPVVHYQQLLLGGAIRVAPYATFGTPELAAAVREALERPAGGADGQPRLGRGRRLARRGGRERAAARVAGRAAPPRLRARDAHGC